MEYENQTFSEYFIYENTFQFNEQQKEENVTIQNLLHR